MALPALYAKSYVVYGSDEKSPFVNVLWWIPESTIVIADGQDAADGLAEALDIAISTDMKLWLPVDCNYFGVYVSLNVSGVTFVAFNSDSAGAGSTEGESLPDFAAVVIRKVTAHGGKTGRGRFFLGCVPENLQDTGRLLPGALIQADNVGDAFTDDVTAFAMLWHGQHYSRLEDTLFLILDTHARPVLGTQRRRRLRLSF